VAARRYQRGWAAASLRVMLASSLLMKKSRPQIPGKDNPSYDELESDEETCDRCGGEIVRNEDGSLYCQDCGRLVQEMPGRPG
jgi:hypothetical protein